MAKVDDATRELLVPLFCVVGLFELLYGLTNGLDVRSDTSGSGRSSGASVERIHGR